MKKENLKNKPFKLNNKEGQFLITAFIWCLLLSLILIVTLKFIVPTKSFVDISVTFYSVVSVFVTFFGSILVYKALQSQIKANKLISNQFKSQQFESQFYEMLRLHKENVNEIELTIVDFIPNNYQSGKAIDKINTVIKGRDCFLYFCNELKISFNLYLKFLKDFPLEKFNFIYPYQAFFNGLNHVHHDNFKNNLIEKTHSFNEKYLRNFCVEKFNEVDVISKYKLFEGHENKLGHYYRHLFHTVKFIVEQDPNFISYKEKRKYLRLLRSQLSNFEQAMLFYNYLAYAEEWEKDNKFFSNYRMIHNLYDSALIDHWYFKKELNKIKNKQKESFCYKDNDHIFEFQKWEEIDYECSNCPK